MKYSISALFFLLLSSLLFAQIDPENIILEIDPETGKQRIIHRDDLSTNVDSFSSMMMFEIRETWTSDMDSAKLEKLLPGQWKLEKSVRINGKDGGFSMTESYSFREDGTYSRIHRGDTTFGKWTIDKIAGSNLQLTYDEPKILIKDMEFFSSLPLKQQKELTKESGSLIIYELDEERLVFVNYVSIVSDPNYMRLLLTHYTRIDD